MNDNCQLEVIKLYNLKKYELNIVRDKLYMQRWYIVPGLLVKNHLRYKSIQHMTSRRHREQLNDGTKLGVKIFALELSVGYVFAKPKYFDRSAQYFAEFISPKPRFSGVRQ